MMKTNKFEKWFYGSIIALSAVVIVVQGILAIVHATERAYGIN